MKYFAIIFSLVAIFLTSSCATENPRYLVPPSPYAISALSAEGALIAYKASEELEFVRTFSRDTTLSGKAYKAGQKVRYKVESMKYDHLDARDKYAPLPKGTMNLEIAGGEQDEHGLYDHYFVFSLEYGTSRSHCDCRFSYFYKGRRHNVRFCKVDDYLPDRPFRASDEVSTFTFEVAD